MEFLTHANSLQTNSTTNPPKPNKPNKPLLLAQGTYGCVYYPGFTCKGKIQKIKYISKLQKNNETLQNELEIGEKIKQIKHYNYYFAPILNQCPVSISNLQTKYPQPLNQCKVVTESQKNNSKSEFNVNKIRYILGEDLDETFEQKNLLTNPSPLLFLLDTYYYLSKSLKKLKKQNILHYDLKANNIIYDKESEIPIIIDFGLSISLDKITPTAPDPKLFTHLFFDTYEYDYWCLEPIFIGMYASYYVDLTPPQTPPTTVFEIPILNQNKTQTLTKEEYNQQKLSDHLSEEYKKTIQQYIDYAYFFKPEFQTKLSQIFPPKQPIQNTIQTFNKTFYDKWQKYIEEHNSDTLLTFFQSLWQSRFTWDHYSLAVIYLDFISQLTPLPPNDPQLPVLESFTQFLLNQLLSLPQERSNHPPPTGIK
jgi:serine/threonine protein kinase